MVAYCLIVSALGTLVHLLLILGTNQLTGCTTRWGKSCLAALISGASAGASLIPGFSFLGQLHWRIISLLLTLFSAFGWESAGLRRAILFSLLHLALVGIALGIGKGGLWSVLVCGATALVMGAVSLHDRASQAEYACISVTHKDRKISLTALIDTGNTLRDPISGMGVIVLDEDAACELLGVSREALQKPVTYLASGQAAGMRLIPYCAIGQPTGMLLGLRADEVRINGKVQPYIVAFAPQKIGQGKPYQALAGGKL